MAQPTAQAQQLLEYVNRMRQNPSAELNLLLNANDPGVNSALNFFNVDRTVLTQQWSTLSATAPVAWSNELADAALGHNQQMIAANQQSHQLPGEPAFGQRATNAGYTGWNTLGENIAAYSNSPFHAHAGLAIDWGNGPSGIQSPPGHRNNIMNPSFREAGFGLTPNTTSFGPLVTTQEFGNRFALSGKAWLLGVAYQDTNRNQFYDVGEGLGGVEVKITTLNPPTPGIEPIFTNTWDAGGYQALLSPGQYQVEFKRNNRLLKSETVTIATQNPSNVKKDLVLAATIAKHDLGGDGKSDILWRNTNGQTALWQMNGLSLASGEDLGTVSPDWKVLESADFNGDGKADIAWYNTISRQVAVWQMDGGTRSAAGIIGSVDTGWSFATTGDFTGDGKADILWRNSNSGQVALWQANGVNPISGSILGSAGLDWTIMGVGDFNGDGQSDILWRNATGEMALWSVNNGAVTPGLVVAAANNDWAVAGITDFDGNSKADILWRNRTSGQVALWSMNGEVVAQIALVGSANSDWAVVDTGDLNGDGKGDILWRNSNSGQVAGWLMDGSNITSSGIIGNANSDWQVAIPVPPTPVQLPN